MKTLMLLTVAGAMAAMGAQTPDPHDIIARSVQAMEANWKEAPHYSWVERDIESKRGSGKTIKTYEVFMLEGSPYNKMIARNDRALTADEMAVENRKLRDEIRKRQHESKRERSKRIAKYTKERNQDHAMMKEMTEALKYTVVGESTVDGHDVWVLEATPKPGYVPKTRDSKVLTGMRGKLWIDKAAGQWVKVEAQVMKPVSFYGFLAKVGPGTKFVLEQEPVAANVWLPKRFSMNVVATALGFLNENSAEEDTYRNYRPMPQVMADLQRQASAR